MATDSRVTDVHIHIQPWEQLKPDVRERMRQGKEDHFEFLLELMADPAALLRYLDERGIWRVGLINYPSQDMMGFDHTTNDFVADYVAHDPRRLIAVGGVHPRFCPDPAGEVDRLVELGIRGLKIHPPHQLIAANAYTEGLDALRAIYERAQHHQLPVTIHTGTSVFPGARCKYGNPMELDDVALDFPDLQLIMAHGGRPLWMDEAFFILRRHRNVWLDVSGIPPKKLLEYFPRFTQIADRALWGTDWPSPGVRDLRTNLDQFTSLPLDEAIQRQVTVDNPLRVYPDISPGAA